MELNALTIYLLSVACSLGVAASAMLAFLTLIGSLVAIFAVVDNGPDIFMEPIVRKIVKTALTVWLSLLLIVMLVPDRKTMVAMVVIPPIVKNEAVKELPTNVVEFINSWLKENSKKD